jgi:hypothetical protein
VSKASASLTQDPAFERALLQQQRAWLSGRPSASAFDGLPDAPDGQATWLWAETPPLLHGMMARATLRWLVEEGGWRKQPHPEGDQVKQGRIWESRAFASLSMRWGAPSARTLTALTAAAAAAHRAAQQPQQPQPPNKKARKEHPAAAALTRLRAALTRDADATSDAEQLALCLISRAVTRHSASGDALAAAVLSALPLGRLWLSPLSPSAPPPCADDALAWGRAWGWTSPWLSDAWSTPWVEADSSSLTLGLVHFRHVITSLAASLNHLTAAALTTECHAWLLPVLSFFRRSYSSDPSPRLAALATLTRGQRVADRQDLHDAWGTLLRAMTDANAARLSIQRTHPADREPHARLLMTYWQSHDMTQTADRVESLRQALERVLG